MYWYRSRFYDQSLGRFIQPDTLVPNPGDPVAFDRYHYSRNSPLVYVDPSGHGYCNSDNAAEDVDCSYTAQNILEEFDGVTFENGNMQWTNEDISAVYMAVMAVGAKIGQVLRAVNDIVLTAGEAFQGIYGNVTFLRGNRRADGSTNGLSEECAGIGTGGCTQGNIINFVSLSGGMYNEMDRMAHHVVHELGHSYDHSLGYGPRLDMPLSIYRNRANILRPNEYTGRLNWQQNLTVSPGETFADMFIAWTYNVWNIYPQNTTLVAAAQYWMSGWMK